MVVLNLFDIEWECLFLQKSVPISVSELWEKVEWDVPEEGEFKMVYAEFKNPDRSPIFEKSMSC